MCGFGKAAAAVLRAGGRDIMHFRRAMAAAKGHIGRAYGHAIRFGMGIDRCVSLARRASGITNPMMKELGINAARADKSVKALGNSYDFLRPKVSKVQDAASNIGSI